MNLLSKIVYLLSQDLKTYETKYLQNFFGVAF